VDLKSSAFSIFFFFNFFFAMNFGPRGRFARDSPSLQLPPPPLATCWLWSYHGYFRLYSRCSPSNLFLTALWPVPPSPPSEEMHPLFSRSFPSLFSWPSLQPTRPISLFFTVAILHFAGRRTQSRCSSFLPPIDHRTLCWSFCMYAFFFFLFLDRFSFLARAMRPL